MCSGFRRAGKVEGVRRRGRSSVVVQGPGVCGIYATWQGRKGRFRDEDDDRIFVLDELRSWVTLSRV